MPRHVALFVAFGITAIGVVGYKSGFFQVGATSTPGSEVTQAEMREPPPADIGKPLFLPASASAPAVSITARRPGAEPIVIPECRLAVIDRQEVPSQRDGIILFVGTEMEKGRPLPSEGILPIRIGNQEKLFRRLKEGDPVRAGQIIGYLDDKLSRDDWAIKNARVVASRADLEAALKSSEEAKNRYDTQVRLQQEARGAAAEEDVRAAKLSWERASFEAMSKREAVTLAERELNQAETILQMHQLRSAAPGVIKAVLKKPGEAVKTFEPVFRIENLDRLRAEGLVDVQYVQRLRPGMRVVVEPAQSEGWQQTFVGHLQEITSVAVDNEAADPTVVSASADGTVRVWDWALQKERHVWRHPAGVLAVACTPPGAPFNLCLTGAADGKARLYTLDDKEPMRELKGQHAGAVTCVAFSPDGGTCATGGEDREICLWDTASGTLRYRFPTGHRGAVTSLQFTPLAQLVSAGRDNTLRLWSVGAQAARLEGTFDSRSGEVVHPGVRCDGKQVLFDQGRTLRLLALPEGTTEGLLQNPSGPGSFAGFAMYSPDSRLILTGGASEGRVQLWRAPTPANRACELRQLGGMDASVATCAAFAPDGTFVVVGTHDRQVRAWSLPPPEEIDRQWTGRISLIEHTVDSSTRQVRIWADVPNLDGRLLPGTPVTIVIYNDDQ